MSEHTVATEKPAADVRVYKYRVPGWWVRNDHVPDVVNEQLRLAHDLYNDLVEIQHRYEKDKAQMWSSFPLIADVEKRLDEAVERSEELATVVTRERSKQRTRSPKHPAVAELREIRDTAKQLRVERRKTISAVRTGADGDKVKVRIEELTAAMYAERKALYADYVQTQGLYWACYNQTLANFKTAVSSVDKKRRANQAAALRFHRWDGSGALAVQLQRSASDPQRTPELLASGEGKWRNVFQIGPRLSPDEFEALPRGERRRTARQGWTKIRIGSGVVDIPIVMHRMLPIGSDVTDVKLVTTRVAQRRRMYVCVTVKIPPPEATEVDNRTIAVHCGWRHEDNGDIRVATWRSDTPLDIDPNVADVVEATTDRSGIIVLPDEWRDGLVRPDTLRSARDERLDEIRAEIVEYLDEFGIEEGPSASEVSKWRSPRRFAKLVEQWNENPPPHSANLRMRLNDWQQWDRRVWGRQEHGRDKHLARRRDAWRRVAAWLADEASTIVVDDSNLASLARKDASNDTGLPVEITKIAARQRVDASPGGLRSDIVMAANRDKRTVVSVKSSGLSSTCPKCRREKNPSDTHEVDCAGCGHRYDRDNAATLLMLERASAES